MPENELLRNLPHAGSEPPNAASARRWPRCTDQASLTEEYLRTVTRHRRAIIGFALTGLFLSLLIGISTEPVYRTRTSVDIRSINADFLNNRAVSDHRQRQLR